MVGGGGGEGGRGHSPPPPPMIFFLFFFFLLFFFYILFCLLTFVIISIFVSPERMFVETHSDPNSVCPCVLSSVRPSVKVSVNLFQIAPVRTGSLQL